MCLHCVSIGDVRLYLILMSSKSHFNVLPDTLVRTLETATCGAARVAWLPPCWLGHVWSGQGTPQHAATMRILDVLRDGGGVLPHRSYLQADADLEASAARALDMCMEAVAMHMDWREPRSSNRNCPAPEN